MKNRFLDDFKVGIKKYERIKMNLVDFVAYALKIMQNFKILKEF